jgi:sugar fermentation stimulation protein A
VIFTPKPNLIKIGKLRFLKFEPGYYCYVGSALKGKLITRVKRHISPSSLKKIHWHIDYLLATSEIRIIRSILIPSSFHEECKIAQTIKKFCIDEVHGFGSSDCNCNSHLFYYGEKEPFN